MPMVRSVRVLRDREESNRKGLNSELECRPPKRVVGCEPMMRKIEIDLRRQQRLSSSNIATQKALICTQWAKPFTFVCVACTITDKRGQAKAEADNASDSDNEARGLEVPRRYDACRRQSQRGSVGCGARTGSWFELRRSSRSGWGSTCTVWPPCGYNSAWSLRGEVDALARWHMAETGTARVMGIVEVGGAQAGGLLVHGDAGGGSAQSGFVQAAGVPEVFMTAHDAPLRKGLCSQ